MDEGQKRKFLLIEQDLGDDKNIVKAKLYDDYDTLLKWLGDEHYAGGLPMFWAIVPCDDDGQYNDVIKKHLLNTPVNDGEGEIAILLELRDKNNQFLYVVPNTIQRVWVYENRTMVGLPNWVAHEVKQSAANIGYALRALGHKIVIV